MGNRDNPRNNSEGYPDPTAYEAEKNIMKEEQNTWEEKKRISELIDVLKYIIDKAGFILIGRIKLKDKKSGKEYK